MIKKYNSCTKNENGSKQKGLRSAIMQEKMNTKRRRKKCYSVFSKISRRATTKSLMTNSNKRELLPMIKLSNGFLKTHNIRASQCPPTKVKVK